MQKDYEEKYHELEELHWWFMGRREIIFSIVKKFPKSARILEIGCSGGALIKLLEENGYKNIFGIDISEKAIELCKKRGLSNIYVMSGEDLKFKGKFDLIIMSDVLEHMKNEKKALKNIKNSLNERGSVICFVPAYMFLWSYHDELNRHYKRYTLDELSMLFKRHGFAIKRESYWNMLLFLPILLGKMIVDKKQTHEKKKASPLHSHGELINYILTGILRAENFLLKYMDFPFGVSAFVIAEKRLIVRN